MDSKILLDTRCRIGYNLCVYESKDLENKQIDEEFDFEFIETMLKTKGLCSPIENNE